MVFSSVVFLFIFLPIVLGVHFLLNKKYKNIFILISSLFFYAWGEHLLVLVMIGSIITNYVFGNLIYQQIKSKKTNGTLYLYLGVIVNLLILGYFKYIHFIIENLTLIGINITFDTSNIILPIGISFFTFQSISYLIDVHQKTVPSQKNIINLGMYISLFPQLIAGPIVRYIDISKEIENRTISSSLFKEGVTRFIIGFSKKIILANNVGILADQIFNIPPDNLSSSISWIGILSYSLQIYFDFSGYSDMAIGLGKMFGFNFKENFNHPYISQSIQEFWRRWHISLSTWFKDYLYIPLGGNRKGKFRTYYNLLIVFFLTGLWHGASWNFIFWGLFHGFFIVIERLQLFTLPQVLKPFKIAYTLLVVMIGWVFFRVETFEDALLFIYKMFSFENGVNNSAYMFLNNYTLFILCIAIILATPIKSYLGQMTTSYKWLQPFKYIAYLFMFFYAILELAHTTYNPFIYFRF